MFTMPIRTDLPQRVVDEIIKSIPEEYRIVGNINSVIDSYLNQIRPKVRRKEVTTIELVHLFTKEHLTLRQIALKVGLSAAAISKRLRNVNIKAKDGTYVDRKCGFCSTPLKVVRSKARKSLNSFCNPKCKGAYISSPNSYEWRHGTRLARVIVHKYFPLDDEMVVHHVDGDESNNNLDNLQVVANQSDHLKLHHKKDVEILWDGKQSPGRVNT